MNIEKKVQKLCSDIWHSGDGGFPIYRKILALAKAEYDRGYREGHNDAAETFKDFFEDGYK